jgi:purine-binding chemotaxis protein CheW
MGLSMNRQDIKTASTLYVVFVLSTEYYGVDMRSTCRILPKEALTRVPKMPPFFKGTVNLRGRHIPVFDIKERLGLKRTRQTTESRIIVVNTAGKDVGFVVDAVAGVLPVLTSSIEPVSTSDIHSNYLSGIITMGSRQVLLLDLDRTFSVSKSLIPSVPTDNEPARVR